MADDATKDMSRNGKIRLMLNGALVLLRAERNTAYETSKAITNELYDDKLRFQIESLLNETAKYNVIIQVIEALLRFL